MESIATKEFKSRVVREYSAGPVENLGIFNNTMELYHIENNEYLIEWSSDDEEIYVQIGIWVENIWVKNKKVTDYDGVFELPKQAIELLKNNGFNTQEVEVRE